jgi:hypothetical protein
MSESSKRAPSCKTTATCSLTLSPVTRSTSCPSIKTLPVRPHIIQSERSWVRICTIVTSSQQLTCTRRSVLTRINGCTFVPPSHLRMHRYTARLLYTQDHGSKPCQISPIPAKNVNNQPYNIPESAAIDLVSSLPIVLFPLPLAPTIPTVDPAGTLRLSPHNT